MTLERLLQLAAEIPDLTEFGDFSISTAKNVIRALAQKGQNPRLVRPATSGEPGTYISPGFTSQDYASISQGYGKPIGPNSIMIPRQVTGEGAKLGIAPLTARMHETGHAADPDLPGFVQQRNQAEADSKAYTETAVQKGWNVSNLEKINKKARGVAQGSIDSEIKANKEVLSQVGKFGTPEEVDAWKKFATGQMRKGYQSPLFKAAKPATLSEGKQIVKALPFIQKKYVKLSTRWGISSARSMAKLIEFAMEI
jgi:hypothetical protein